MAGSRMSEKNVRLAGRKGNCGLVRCLLYVVNLPPRVWGNPLLSSPHNPSSAVEFRWNGDKNAVICAKFA